MAERKSTKSGEESGVTEHDDNYLGTSPEYMNSAYEVTAPIAADAPEQPDEDDPDYVVKSAAVAGAEVEQRVREHVEAMAEPAEKSVTAFQEWLNQKEERRSGTPVVDTEDVSKAELMEEARELDIEGRSSMNKDELATAVAEAHGNS